MAFTPETFVVCSKFPLFRASSNLWLYVTSDSLEDCLAENYFRPRQNLKNQDSPEVGDVIQLVVEHSKLAYLKIVGKTERPYNITVARTYLENEAQLLALITELQLNKADKVSDFVTAITDENKGITQAEQSELEEKIDTAANSGRMITPQGFWYAKMYAGTVAPSAEDGTNYADFSQTDIEGNPIIVTYNRVSGAWVQDETITPPADFDGYVPITSKIWDISEQDGQQGGRILWNHTSKEFTPYPSIVSFDSIEITGNSTVDMPVTPSDDNIANVGFVKNSIGSARNIGDMFFTMRLDSAVNGAVECDGNTYDTTNFTGSGNIGELLALNKIPYVSMATYATLLASQGSCGVFGWDGVGNTEFRVPSLNDIFIETGKAAEIGDYITASVPNITGSLGVGPYTEATGTALGIVYANGAFAAGASASAPNHVQGAGGYATRARGSTFDASRSSAVYKNDVTTVQPETIRYRPMVQLAVGSTDEAFETCTQVLSDVAGLKSHEVIEFQAPTADNNYTWYRKYADGWVEQGGIKDMGTVGGNTGISQSVSLLVEMADTNYTIQITRKNGGSGYAQTEWTTNSLGTTTFSIGVWNNVSGTATIGSAMWQVSGMYAQ